MAQSTGIPGLGPGDRLGPYVLETVLGEGAIGVVFRAAADDGSVVALKILRKELSRDEVYRRRFAREARIASVVRHRHLVPILDLGEAHGYHYLAVAYVDGGSTPRGLSRSMGRSSSRPRLDPRSTRCTPRESFTATSSRPTSCSMRSETQR